MKIDKEGDAFMKWLDHVEKTVPVIQITEPVWKAVNCMKAASLNELPVLSGQTFSGILHAKDLLNSDPNNSIKEYIDKDCCTINGPEELYFLPFYNHQLLPVINNGIYHGCISRNTLHRLFYNELSQMILSGGSSRDGLTAPQKTNNTKRSSKVIGHSQKMKEIFDIVHYVAPSDSTVLLLGASGVGKEVIAKMLHENSCRKKELFMKVNCGAIPPHLLESELFGYEQGAFTGAKRGGKLGIFEMASGGTLFLDEIGDLPLDMQVKLLRVLQEQEIMRVGGLQIINVNVRIIAATNRNLERMVEEGTFRTDLYYRLNIVPIKIPLLRERKDDIIPLLNYFLMEFNAKYNSTKRFSKQAVQQLMSYPFPGNVRELSNIVERLVLTSRSDVIESCQLPKQVLTCLKTESGPPDQENKSMDTLALHWNTFGQGDNLFDYLEKEALIRTLKKYGSVRKAGTAIGVPHTTVFQKMKKYGVTLKAIR